MKKITIVFNYHEASRSFQSKIEFTSPIKAYFYITDMARLHVLMDISKTDAEKNITKLAETWSESLDLRIYHY
jgi:hypothetical protein